MTQAHSDPRSIITPDAFSISGDLIGLPLAAPSRRLVALLVDLVLIGVLSQAGGLLLGFVVAVAVFRLATRRGERTPASRAFRASLGCFGAFVVGITAVVAWGLLTNRDDGAPGLVVGGSGDTPGVEVGLGDILGGMAAGAAVRTAGSEAEALAAATGLVSRLRNAGIDRDEIEDVLPTAIPPEAPWARTVREQAMAALDAPADPAPDAAGAGVDEAALAGLSDEAALERYAELLRSGGEGDAAERSLLRRRLAGALAGDTIQGLLAEIEDLESEEERIRERLAATRAALSEAEDVGEVEAFFRFIADDLGLAFGWGTVYLSVFLVWWKGQTPGKRLLGIRVLRLDGGPVTGWVAFERAGGYAAGFATGLLGFAQVLWDPNRQAIHDKIVSTVVVRDGQPRVPGLWHAQSSATPNHPSRPGDGRYDERREGET